LLSKNGIAAPASHPIRQAVERHKARLKAELTKARVRRGCASLQDLQSVILEEKKALLGPDALTENMYPRWVRINNVRSTLKAQLDNTFSGYRNVESLKELRTTDQIYIDPHIPDLVALAPGAVDFSATKAYKDGEIILQDKASCFPAYLLLGDPDGPWSEGDLVDGCAAPGNKTTHLASLLAARRGFKNNKKSNKIISMDSSAPRSKTLQKMVSVAGADKIVTVLAGQDFLALDPADERFESVSGLLLDPSCSGSGIIGRDDVPQLILPQSNRPSSTSNGGKKRKRDKNENEEEEAKQGPPERMSTERLTKLSNLQTHIVEHALRFPAASRVTYSTCSTHVLENESVVSRILASDVAKQRGWRVMRRDEQPAGLQKWKHRGIKSNSNSTDEKSRVEVNLSEEQLDACLRCWPGDDECTGGFFVVGFVRDEELADSEATGQDSGDESEWGGFSD
jgi:putative methyltransferase